MSHCEGFYMLMWCLLRGQLALGLLVVFAVLQLQLVAAHGDAAQQCKAVAAAADIQEAISQHDQEVTLCIDTSRCVFNCAH